MTFDTTGLFNATIASSAIAAAADVGLFDRLREGCVDLRRYCAERRLHEPSLSAIVRALAGFDIVTVAADGGTVSRGSQFERAYADKGYFIWLVRGYGQALQHLAELCRLNASAAPGVDGIGRDSRYIALAGLDYGARFVDPHVRGALEREQFTVVADLGCGSGARLIDIVSARPGTRGIGVDINPETAALACERVRHAGLADRITIVCDDVRRLAARPEYLEVDLLLSFFMGHDLWPHDACLAIFSRLPQLFPSVKRFLLCDTYRTPADAGLPIFVLGFELTHALMRQEIPSESDWQGLFDEAGWTCVGAEQVGIPSSAIFELRPAACARSAVASDRQAAAPPDRPDPAWRTL